MSDAPKARFATFYVLTRHHSLSASLNLSTRSDSPAFSLCCLCFDYFRRLRTNRSSALLVTLSLMVCHATVSIGQIFVPFIVVSSSNDTVIQCEMAENREDVFFNFRWDARRPLTFRWCPFANRLL